MKTISMGSYLDDLTEKDLVLEALGETDIGTSFVDDPRYFALMDLASTGFATPRHGHIDKKWIQDSISSQEKVFPSSGDRYQIFSFAHSECSGVHAISASDATAKNIIVSALTDRADEVVVVRVSRSASEFTESDRKLLSGIDSIGAVLGVSVRDYGVASDMENDGVVRWHSDLPPDAGADFDDEEELSGPSR